MVGPAGRHAAMSRERNGDGVRSAEARSILPHRFPCLHQTVLKVLLSG